MKHCKSSGEKFACKILMKSTPDDHNDDDDASSNLLLDLHRRGTDSIKVIGDCEK
jgi:hypothetical protein